MSRLTAPVPGGALPEKGVAKYGKFSQESQFQLVWSLLFALSMFVTKLYGGNDVLGEIELVGATKVEKTSGVWIDGQYVGYLKELKGSKKILLLPGEHEIVVRQAGIQGFLPKSHDPTWRKTSHPSGYGEGSPDADSDDNCRNQTFRCPG